LFVYFCIYYCFWNTLLSRQLKTDCFLLLQPALLPMQQLNNLSPTFSLLPCWLSSGLFVYFCIYYCSWNTLLSRQLKTDSVFYCCSLLFCQCNNSTIWASHFNLFDALTYKIVLFSLLKPSFSMDIEKSLLHAEHMLVGAFVHVSVILSDVAHGQFWYDFGQWICESVYYTVYIGHGFTFDVPQLNNDATH